MQQFILSVKGVSGREHKARWCDVSVIERQCDVNIKGAGMMWA